MNFIFPYIGNFIIPTDFHIFQRGRCTTNQSFPSRSVVLDELRGYTMNQPPAPSRLGCWIRNFGCRSCCCCYFCWVHLPWFPWGGFGGISDNPDCAMVKAWTRRATSDPHVRCQNMAYVSPRRGCPIWSGVRLERRKLDRLERRKVDRLERRKVTGTDT